MHGKGFFKTVRKEDLSRKKCLLEGEKSASQSEYLVCLLPISSAGGGKDLFAAGMNGGKRTHRKSSKMFP
jgi:hypothetical protein